MKEAFNQPMHTNSFSALAGNFHAGRNGHDRTLIAWMEAGQGRPSSPKDDEHCGADRWYGRPRGKTLDMLLLLPLNATYGAFSQAVFPTQQEDPLGLRGWTKVMIELAGYGRGDLAPWVLRWVQEAAKLQADDQLYCAAITAYEKTGLWQQALTLHADLVHRREPQSVATYTAAMAACSQGAQSGHAVELLSCMQTRAIDSCVRAGQLDYAERQFDSKEEEGKAPGLISESLGRLLQAKLIQGRAQARKRPAR